MRHLGIYIESLANDLLKGEIPPYQLRNKVLNAVMLEVISHHNKYMASKDQGNASKYLVELLEKLEKQTYYPEA